MPCFGPNQPNLSWTWWEAGPSFSRPSSNDHVVADLEQAGLGVSCGGRLPSALGGVRATWVTRRRGWRWAGRVRHLPPMAHADPRARLPPSDRAQEERGSHSIGLAEIRLAEGESR